MNTKKYTMCALILATLLLILTISNQAFAASLNGSSGHGLYILIGGANAKYMESLLNVPGIAGMSLSAEWPELEPQEGHYNWAALDKPIKAAASLGRRVTLRVFPGITTPDWVYAKGAKAFEFVDRYPFHGDELYRAGARFNTYGKTLRIPLPWDEVFLGTWERFVAAFGAQYKDERSIAMVHIAGPTRHSTEMILPREKEDRAKWLALGYTPQKLITAWKRSIDAFGRAFPNTALVLNLSPVIFDDGVLEAVARYGYEKYGRRFYMQNNILLADNKGMQRHDWRVLKEYAPKTTIGFQRELLQKRAKGWQELPQAEWMQMRRRNFAGMFAQGLALGAKYFEVGAAEVRDFPEVVRDVAARLE